MMKKVASMTQIRPVSDLRNSFADISRTVHETGEPVILTKNGYGDMVVLAYESYQSMQFEMGVVRELRAAEMEAETTTERIAHKEERWKSGACCIGYSAGNVDNAGKHMKKRAARH